MTLSVLTVMAALCVGITLTSAGRNITFLVFSNATVCSLYYITLILFCCYLHCTWPVGPYALNTRRPSSADRTARAANFRRDLEAT